LYYSPNIIRLVKLRRIRWAGHVTCIRMKIAYKIFVRKHEQRRPLRGIRRRWLDNIKMDYEEI